MNSYKLNILAAAVSVVLFACGGPEATDGSLDGVDSAAGTESDLSTATKGKFETFVGIDGKHYFHLLAGNGEKVLASQGYSSAQAAETGIASVQLNGVDSRRYLTREAADGATYFVVTAANGEIIGVSEMYATPSDATRAQGTTQLVVKNTVAKGAALLGNARFENFKGLDGKYYFHLRGGNGEIILQSQSYTSSTSAKNGVASVQTNGTSTSRYQVLAAADGQSYVVLKAANGQIIARSETYVSKSNADRAIATCVKILSGPDAR